MRPITVVVCTRDRGDSVARCVRSIMQSDYAAFDLVVVDQSDVSDTADSLSEWSNDSRFTYLRSSTRGLSRARNFGIARSNADMIAMTDDDCEAAPDWLTRISDSFDADKRIGIVLGNVTVGAHDKGAGFVPGYLRKNAFLAKGMRDKPHVEGIGASMAIRKDVWTNLGGFDPMLGAGAAFPSAEDTDFIIRALLAGYYVYENPAAKVVHHGFRHHGDANALTSAYLMGIGATLGKHLKCGHLEMLPLMWSLAARWSFSQPVVEYGFKPARLPRLRGFAEGFIKGLSSPVDRKTSMFRELPGVPDRQPADRKALDV